VIFFIGQAHNKSISAFFNPINADDPLKCPKTWPRSLI